MNKNENKIGDPATVSVDVAKIGKIRICKECIICGEGVELTEIEEAHLRHGYHIDSKICDKCRLAILYIRNQIQ